MMAMQAEGAWRGVMVAPPNPYAGIGGALRHAFMIDGAARSPDRFSQLLARLDKPDDRAGTRAAGH